MAKLFKFSKLRGVQTTGLLLTLIIAFGYHLGDQPGNMPTVSVRWPQAPCAEAIEFLLLPSGTMLPAAAMDAACP